MKGRLTGYQILTRPDARFIKNWNIIGVDNHGNEFMIDEKADTPLCSTKTGSCSEQIISYFDVSESKRTFSTFKIKLAGPDSYNESILSFSRILFYGSFYQNVIIKTITISCKYNFLIYLFNLIMI
jgi:hypothetical protein